MAKVLEASTMQHVQDVCDMKRNVSTSLKPAMNDICSVDGSTDDESTEDEESSISVLPASNLDEFRVFQSVEIDPPIQFGLDGRNLFTIYRGRLHKYTDIC